MPLSCQLQKLVVASLRILGREVDRHRSFRNLTRHDIVFGVPPVVNSVHTQVPTAFDRFTSKHLAPTTSSVLHRRGAGGSDTLSCMTLVPPESMQRLGDTRRSLCRSPKI